MMIDWNGNMRLDPTDIGISIASGIMEENITQIDLNGYPFDFIQELVPEKTFTGKIKTFDPKTRYGKSEQSELHQYGNGPFCKFSIRKGYYGSRGVYALYDDEDLLYIGQTVNLEQRYNQGYGSIQPRNCFVGGQITNCKINSMVLNKYQSGGHIYLFFYRTDDYDRIEQQLISLYRPPYNSVGTFNHHPHFNVSSKKHTEEKKMEDANTYGSDFENIWQTIASLQGETFYTVKGKPFTYKVVGNSLYPTHIYSSVRKKDFKKAFDLDHIKDPAQLADEHVFGPTYVYAILTDKRVKAQ